MLIDIQEKLKQGKGGGYKRWATVYNIKQMAQTLLFLQERDIRSYDVLSEKANGSAARFNELSQTIKDAEKRLGEIAVLRTHIINYAKTRDVYVAYYRNKRLGEFLKELDLTEGKSTGIPTIQEELRDNGSPKATFETDDERRAVTVEIPIHPDFLIEHGEPQNEPQNGPQNEPQNTNSVEDVILQLIRMNKHITREEMASQMEVSLSTVKRAINKLKASGIIEYEGPSKGGYWIIKQ